MINPDLVSSNFSFFPLWSKEFNIDNHILCLLIIITIFLLVDQFILVGNEDD